MTSKQAVERIMKVLGLAPQSFFEAKTEQGMAIKMEGELEVGAPIYIATEEGLIPAPPGVHKLDDGSEIEVDEEGKVSKIKMGETEDAEIEDEKEEEVIKEDEMSAVEMEFGDVKLVDGTILRMEGEGEIVGRRLKKVGYDGTLSAIADGEYETEGGKVLQIVGGAIEGVQSKADNAKRKTGFAEYPWDECMDDQMKQYGDEEIAKKVCGAIKAGNMAEEFAIAVDKAGDVLHSPEFKIGDEVHVIQADGSMVRAKDQGYDIELHGKPHTIFVTDGKVSDIQPGRKAEGPEDVKIEEMAEIAQLFSNALKKFETKLDAIASKQEVLESKFQKFSKEPAGSRVFTQKTINEDINPLATKYEGFRKLRESMMKN